MARRSSSSLPIVGLVLPHYFLVLAAIFLVLPLWPPSLFFVSASSPYRRPARAASNLLFRFVVGLGSLRKFQIRIGCYFGFDLNSESNSYFEKSESEFGIVKLVSKISSRDSRNSDDQ